MSALYTYRQHGSPAPAIVGVDTLTGADLFTVALPAADASLLTRAFVALSDGSILAPNFGSGDGTVALDLIRVTPDGTTTSVPTGLTGEPRVFLGGYQHEGGVYLAVMLAGGAQIIRLDAGTLTVTHAEFYPGFNASCSFTQGADACVLMVSIEATLFSHVDLSVITSHWLDEDDWTGYDADWRSMQAFGVACADGVLYNDLLVFSGGNGNTVRVLTARDATTLERTGLIELKPDANNDYWGSSALTPHEGGLLFVASTPAGWRAMRLSTSPLAIDASEDTSLPGGVAYAHPTGPMTISNSVGYVGVDVNASAPVSAAASLAPATLTVSWNSAGTLQESSGSYELFGPVAVASGPTGAARDPRDRLRSTASEDLGSLLDAVEAIPVDLGFDVAFTNAVSLEPGVLTTFREATRATDSPVVDLMYYPRPRQNVVMEEQFDGVTILSRLASWYPPRLYGTTTELGLGSTPQSVITGILNRWAQLQPWLVYKPVPDLRIPLGLAPEEYGPTDGLVTVETVTLSQDEDRRMTALGILHDFLSPFPGTVLRQDSDGELAIVPFYGPDADAEPVVVLREFDTYSVSAGKPDPFTTINRATFQAVGGRERGENVSVMQAAWFQVGSNYRLGDSDAWFEPAPGIVNLQPPRQGDTTLQESLSFGQFNLQKPNVWPMGVDSIPAGAGIGLEDEFGGSMIAAAWRVFGPGGGVAFTGSGSANVLAPVIPFSGAWVDAFRITFDLYNLTMRARWNESAGGVEWSIGSNTLEANCWAGCWTAVVEFSLTDSSVGFAEAGMTSVTFGVIEAGDSIPSAAGGNAVAESQAAYGVRERQVTVTGYAFDAASLTAAARGYVLHNITPRVTRGVELSVAGSVALQFDHVGRLIELPSGERGVLIGLRYADEFTSGAWAKSAQVQISDTSAAGGVTPNPFEGVLVDSSGVALTDSAGNPIHLSGGA